MRALLLLSLFPFASWADCAASSWSVFPWPGSTVPANSRFVVEGHGRAQQVALTLATRSPRLVDAKGKELELTVIEVNVGEFDVTQAVLQPKVPLTQGSRYTLKFEAPNEAFFAPQGTAWWNAGATDDEAPRWSAAPTALAGSIAQMGCGPAVEAQISVRLQETSPIQMRAKVTRADGSVRQYLVAPQKERLALGHGMCGGPFRFREEAWTLELVAVDAAGNSAPSPGGLLHFKGVEPKKP